MLPFRKKQDDGVGVGPLEVLERKPDEEGEDFSMLDAVAEDLLMAIEKKDKKLLREALKSLCMHIQDMDEEQDAGMAGE